MLLFTVEATVPREDVIVKNPRPEDVALIGPQRGLGISCIIHSFME